MRPKTVLMTMTLTTVGLAAVFLLLQGLLTHSRTVVGIHPEVVTLMKASLEDQKTLARLQPEQAPEYRKRFSSVEDTLHHLEILRYNRRRISRRLAYGLTATFGLVLAATMAFETLRQRRDQRRLQRLRDALIALSQGYTDIAANDSAKDIIGRIGAMIEETSRTMAGQRRRLDALRNLELWQETARRQAHELRTPLTSARLEVGRLRSAASKTSPDAATVNEIARGIEEDLERLTAMISSFASFAKVAKPSLEPANLAGVAAAFVETFGDAWPETTLELRTPDHEVPVLADPKLIHHVLANLAENSSRSAAVRCTIEISVGRQSGNEAWIEVSDDGPGIDEEVADRLFEPYTTTRADGQGLGLAIARKIMLDHGGDLELMKTSAAGSVFRLILPAANGEPS